MSAHSDADPGTVPGRPARVSRRSVLRGAAGAGLAGLAATGFAAAGFAAAGFADTGGAAAADAAAPARHAAEHAEPVVVYLRDAGTGELEVFAGTSQVRFRDHALAARLLRAVQ